jgi:hypothetical protein
MLEMNWPRVRLAAAIGGEKRAAHRRRIYWRIVCMRGVRGGGRPRAEWRGRGVSILLLPLCFVHARGCPLLGPSEELLSCYLMVFTKTMLEILR